MKEILILEDKVIHRQTLVKMLQDMGGSIRIHDVETVAEAYKISMENVINIFLVDIIIDTQVRGDISGLKFVEAIRKIPHYSFTPIIFITSLEDPEMYAYRNLHCFGYIEKPFNKAEVKGLICQALKFPQPSNNNESIYFRKEGIVYAIRKADIVFIEITRRQVVIYTTKESMEIPYRTVEKLLSELNSKNFLCCNRGCIVSKRHVEYIDYVNRYIKMQGVDQYIEIGRTMKEKVMNLGIEIIAYLCECMMQLLCIHSFLGKKIKFDLKVIITIVMFVSVLLFTMRMDLSSLFTLIPHLVMFLYVLWEFRIKIWNSIIIILFDILICGLLQILIAIPISLFSDVIYDNHIMGLLINILSIIFMSIIYNRVKLDTLYNRTIKWNRTISWIYGILFIVFVCLLVRYKISEKMEMPLYFLCAILVFMVINMTLNWQKDRYKMKQRSIELYMYELYGKTFEEMIENIRIRQHDFKNQIAAVYGMHLTSDNFDELVEKQKKYCDYLMEESRYDSILTKCNDKILAGFLYTKFNECENSGISIDFDIVLRDSNCKLATYELIEVSGILIDNASENEMNRENHESVRFEIKDDEDKIIIICRNQIDYISLENINKFFKKGYSSKGEGRGLGLYNIKKLLAEKGDVIVSTCDIKDKNYIEFKIEINR